MVESAWVYLSYMILACTQCRIEYKNLTVLVVKQIHPLNVLYAWSAKFITTNMCTIVTLRYAFVYDVSHTVCSYAPKQGEVYKWGVFVPSEVRWTWLQWQCIELTACSCCIWYHLWTYTGTKTRGQCKCRVKVGNQWKHIRCSWKGTIINTLHKALVQVHE